MKAKYDVHTKQGVTTCESLDAATKAAADAADAADATCIVEHGTLLVDGQPYIAEGACLTATEIVCYPTPLHDHHVSLRTWGGEEIMRAVEVGYARGFRKTKLTCYRAAYQGHWWHGRGQGSGMILRMRRGRKVAR